MLNIYTDNYPSFVSKSAYFSTSEFSLNTTNLLIEGSPAPYTLS